jgi:nucleotide-binding universal stress UspA family protein
MKRMGLLEMAPDRELTTVAPPQPRVVLGLDAASTAASMVEWAAQEAIARGAALQIVTSSERSCSSASCTARRIPVLMEAVTATRERHPLLSIEETTVRLDTQHELIDTAASADLLIVGEPYLGISTRHLLGSTAGVAVRRSSCPVIALRGQQRQPLRRIAVGIDDSNAAAAALDWAANEADRHGAELIVIHAWQRVGQTLRSVDRDRAKAQRIVDDAVDHCTSRGRAVSCELVDGPAIPALAAASMNVDLIAVGSRGSSGYRTMLFGPVARFVLANADCPVAVIHPRVRVA